VRSHTKSCAAGIPLLAHLHSAHDRACKRLNQICASFMTCRYMIVGFEVVPCSIHRNPGARLEDIPCPMSPDDPDAPKPMEVTKGAFITVKETMSMLLHRPEHFVQPFGDEFIGSA
jgi:hypothetical protein